MFFDTNAFQDIKTVRCTTARAAGTANSTGAMLDRAGYQGVAFMAVLGAATAAGVATLSMKGGNSTTSTAATALTPSATITETTDGAAENGILLLDERNPVYRYYWPILALTMQNIAVDGVLGFAYRPTNTPVTQDADVVDSSFTEVSST